MVSICCFVALARVAQGEVVPVRFMRPSALIERINEFMPSTVLTADDEKGVLIIRAGADVTTRLKSLIRSYDVKPARIRLRVETNSPIDRERGEVETVVASNKPFRFTDGTTNVEIAALPRLNTDGTITVTLQASYRGSRIETVFRCKNGKPIEIRLGRTAGEVEETSATEKDRLEWPTLRVSASTVSE